MPGCSAYGCSNRPGKKVPGVSFHHFPKDDVLRAAWIVACRRKDWMPSSTSVLCSEHFTEDLFDRTSKSRVQLQKTAIPNVFKGYSPDIKYTPTKDQLPAAMTIVSGNASLSHNICVSESSKKINAVEQRVYLNTPKDKSCVEVVLPAQVAEQCRSPEKRLMPTTASSHKDVILLSDENKSQVTATKYNVIQSTVSPNSLVNKRTRIVKIIPLYISNKWKSSGDGLATNFTSKEEVELSNENVPKTLHENDVVEATVCSNIPVTESSVKNTPPVQISKKRKALEDCLASTTSAKLTNNERIEFSDKNIPKTLPQKNVVETIICSNIPVKESSVKNILPMQIPNKWKASLDLLAYTAATQFANNKLIELSDENVPKTLPESNVVEETVCSNIPVKESSVENTPPVQTSKECESAEKNFLSTTPSSEKEVTSLNNGSKSIAPAKCVVVKSAVSSNSLINKSQVENRISDYIAKKRKVSENHMTYTAATNFSNQEVIELSDEDEDVPPTLSESDVEAIVSSTVPAEESGEENMSLVEIPVVDPSSSDKPVKYDPEKMYLKRKLAESDRLLVKYRKKIKTLQQQNRRWKEQLEKTKRSLKNLQKATKFIFED